MSKTLWIISSLLALVLGSPVAKAGGAEGSGGSDYFRPLRAWFLSLDSSKRIQGCYEVAPNFGVSEQELHGMVLQAFKTWGQYIERKQISSHLAPNSMRIISALDLTPVCDGNEDLKVYFGTDDMKVVKAKVQYYKPFGFVELNSDEQPQKHWSPGFIWIANNGSVFSQNQVPKWQVSKEALYSLILHEVGHVFGNGHADDTVMTVHLGEFLTADTDPKNPLKYISSYNRIDSVLELMPCQECSLSYQAPRQFDGTPFIPGNDDLSNSYRLLTGHDPIEPLSATFTRNEAGQSEIVFNDGSGIQRFPLKVTTLLGTKQDSARMFNGHGGKYFTSYGVSYFGEIQPMIGSPIPIAINYNMDRRKLAIIPLGIEMKPKPLFIAVP